MSSSIPTGRTYLGFALLWYAVIFVVWLACIVLFKAGYIVTAILTLLLTAYGFFRHARSLVRRAKQGIRRPSPELRRWLSTIRDQGS